MEIKINIQKKHLYILSLLIILIGGILFVRGQGRNFGHSASDVYVNIGGEEMNLQDAFAGEGGMKFDGQKICSMIRSGDWRDSIIAPSSWSGEDCRRWAKSFTGNTHYDLICFFENNFSRSGNIDIGKSPNKFPDPDCGWNESAQ